MEPRSEAKASTYSHANAYQEVITEWNTKIKATAIATADNHSTAKATTKVIPRNQKNLTNMKRSQSTETPIQEKKEKKETDDDTITINNEDDDLGI